MLFTATGGGGKEPDDEHTAGTLGQLADRYYTEAQASMFGRRPGVTDRRSLVGPCSPLTSGLCQDQGHVPRVDPVGGRRSRLDGRTGTLSSLCRTGQDLHSTRAQPATHDRGARISAQQRLTCLACFQGAKHRPCRNALKRREEDRDFSYLACTYPTRPRSTLHCGVGGVLAATSQVAGRSHAPGRRSRFDRKKRWVPLISGYRRPTWAPRAGRRAGRSFAELAILDWPRLAAGGAQGS
ncbi:hypothetical protein GQ53DRAFT_71697 [Thozetella sp. PMI_491]|nr:hypothetical protein GQ53DRAFT_71697 [Thozetella sp. PMI_491]